MKKLIGLMMALAIIATFAACGTKDETDHTTAQTTTAATENETDITVNTGNSADSGIAIDQDTTALELLEQTWIALGGEHQPASIGGHFSEENTGGPATYNLSYAEDLAATLLLPEDQMDSVADAATVVHMLNANSLTAGVIKLSDGTDVQAFADAVADRIANNQWMCGFPEKMSIVQIGDNFLFIAYGLYDLVTPMAEGVDQSWSVNVIHDRMLIEEESAENVES